MNIQLISNFNIDPLKRALLSYKELEDSKIICSPYGQIYQSIMNIKKKQDLIIVWFTPEHVIPSFLDCISRKSFSIEQLVNETNKFTDLIVSLASKTNILLVPSLFSFSHYKTYGLLDYKKDIGPSRILLDINTIMAEKLDSLNNAYLIDSSIWYSNTINIVNHKMNYLTKVPFSIEIFQKSALTIINALKTIKGKAKKLIVIDLDNTIWGGVVGEDGYDAIELGGHSYIGEAYKDFQKELLSLTEAGIQIAIVSKNDENTAIEAIEKHPEMILKLNNIVSWRINWEDKAKNILSIAKELNIQLDSIIFIDDNPIERSRVRESVPEILVLDWPNDPTQYPSLLRDLSCFDTYSLTTEDKNRNLSYLENTKRKNESYKYESIQEWLAKLETELTIEKVNKQSIKRCTQLINKTNQFNLSTRRLTENELDQWIKQKNNVGFSVSLKDKFGILGIIGFIGLEIKNEKIKVIDLILSCRAMGRDIEEAMLYFICKLSNRDKNSDIIEFNYKKTNRNNPVLAFLTNCHQVDKNNGLYILRNPFKVDKPRSIKINQ